MRAKRRRPNVRFGDSGKSRGSESEIRALITRLIVAAVCTIPVFGSTMLMLYPMPNWLQFLLMLPIVAMRHCRFSAAVSPRSLTARRR